tara:strand:+ start:587 stop:799 length:213 start_codon:yes stop_codon:yes gene_type:complete
MKENRIKIEEFVKKIVEYLDAQTTYNKMMIDDYKKWEKIECCCSLCPGESGKVELDEKLAYPDNFMEDWK